MASSWAEGFKIFHCNAVNTDIRNTVACERERETYDSTHPPIVPVMLKEKEELKLWAGCEIKPWAVINLNTEFVKL